MTERIEYNRELVLLDTDTRILHTEPHSHIVLVRRNQLARQAYHALFVRLARRKLDRVSDQVGDNLPQTERVADNLIWNLWIDFVEQIEVLLVRANDERLENTKRRSTEGVRDLLHRHPARLDCMQVST